VLYGMRLPLHHIMYFMLAESNLMKSIIKLQSNTTYILNQISRLHVMDLFTNPSSGLLYKTNKEMRWYFNISKLI